ncbi:hypothetical protein RAS1_04710 [Phycisphaerae bacterium RAS1]|nr:hypothetical protein RAS1_04710 [Phycisphaerae bacterium RAS1]
MANSPASSAAIPNPGSSSRWIIAILLPAAAWRGVIAWNLPTISRDGVTFCWYARDLGTSGLDYLRSPAAIQHPLYPALILMFERLAEWVGAAPSPMLWQRAAQVVAILAGLAVVLLSGAIARRIALVSRAAGDPGRVGLLAMLIAALLPLNIELSADAMSDQLHLAFYLLAIRCALAAPAIPAAAACGAFSGLAFLTRPEGLVAAAAGLLTSALTRQSIARRAAQVLALLLGAAVIASPYWLLTGKLSAKKNPLDWFEPAPASASQPPSGFAIAKLERVDLRWFELAPRALLEIFRGGRVIVILLAIPLLVLLGRSWLRPPLLMLTACALGHFSLLIVLLEREGYLAPRHTLVVVSLLIPSAAAALDWMIARARRPRSAVWRAAAVACLIPLAVYSLRLPNHAERWMRTSADWLKSYDPSIADKRILGGASTKRLAFYAGAAWSEWNEQPRYYPALCDMIVKQRPAYFAVETGGGFERVGNRTVLDRLLSDRRFASRMRVVHTEHDGRGNDLHLLAFDW